MSKPVAIRLPNPKRPRPCQANHCTWAAESGRLMCIQHWLLLPGALQGQVLTTWRAAHAQGGWQSSPAYLDAAATAVEFIARKEGRLERNVFRELANQVKAEEIKKCQ